ncbi:type II toxin-antitoxin system VapC family toxin [Thermococcus celer]|uniref:PIN domain-containing protein n=1 Tax=Thermococcus celer Vu 13 = JCM 8558 TaxID=1293037 RepID=A0A218P1T5_THECE|nr:type II toxin-antitoxin system VapC family toxin [Thermococcus celer]ASI98891.1 hypothetical protein A3L02_04615 [Thermococcus celer Vu 13 = JCM 8558]
MLVVDTSVLIDATIPVRGKEKRNELARGVISAAESRREPLVIPRLGVVETVSLIKRLTGAKKFNAILLSSDKDMVKRAGKIGVRAFYILDETDVERFYKELPGGV